MAQHSYAFGLPMAKNAPICLLAGACSTATPPEADFVPSFRPGDGLISLKSGQSCLAMAKCLQKSPVLAESLALARQQPGPIWHIKYAACARQSLS